MITQVLKATAKHSAEVRNIAQQFSVSGCKLGTRTVHAGRQNEYIDTVTAHLFMDALKASGFRIDSEATSRELADKGFLDIVMVAKIMGWK